MPWEVTSLGNRYVAIDGEGVGNDYVLLDSSLPELPRLYTGRRLSTIEIFDWLWKLAETSGKCTYVLYGATYDYNNWVRDLPLDLAKLWAKGAVIEYGDYVFQYMPGFRFELRKVKYREGDKIAYDRIRYDGADLKRGILFYDVLPFWQTSFIKALDMTLGERTLAPELIEAGKAKRGEFTHDEINWVTDYNENECYNLVEMCNTLDSWFSEAGIEPRYMNGPGAAAKAVLKQLNYGAHSGRDYTSGRVGGYLFPGVGLSKQADFLKICLSAYAGGRNQHTGIGYSEGVNYQYDKISAYPSACIDLPCLTHGRWKKVLRPSSPTAFGIYRISYSNPDGWLHPYFVRWEGNIIYPSQVDERWIWNSELQPGLQAYGNCTTIYEGWEWVPEGCANALPLQPLRDIFSRRKIAKARGNDALSLILKLPLNSAYGSLAQSRGGTLDAPPPTQQILWAGWITGKVRGDIFHTAMANPSSVCHLATDGLLSTERLAIPTGEDLGDWEETEIRDLTVVGYGIYAGYVKGKFKYRTRGFALREDQAESFFTEVHKRWIEGWDSIQVEQKLFVTAGLAHEPPPELADQFNPSEWCSWKTLVKQIKLTADDELRGSGRVERFPGMYRVREYSNSILPDGVGFTSDPYRGNWGVSAPWPDEITPESEYGVLDWN